LRVLVSSPSIKKILVTHLLLRGEEIEAREEKKKSNLQAKHKNMHDVLAGQKNNSPAG
jgi:hypothetical protein